MVASTASRLLDRRAFLVFVDDGGRILRASRNQSSMVAELKRSDFFDDPAGAPSHGPPSRWPASATRASRLRTLIPRCWAACAFVIQRGGGAIRSKASAMRSRRAWVGAGWRSSSTLSCTPSVAALNPPPAVRRGFPLGEGPQRWDRRPVSVSGSRFPHRVSSASEASRGTPGGFLSGSVSRSRTVVDERPLESLGERAKVPDQRGG